MYSTLISVEQLKAISAVVIDCSADLAKPEAGRAQFEEQHIAGALFADINTDLASHNPALAVNGGRHPLPSREHFALWLSACGISEHTQVVVYDRQGMNYCGRLWWMLKWCGHEAVAVLDGGLQAWAGAGGALASGPALPVTQAEFTLREPLLVLKHTAEVFEAMGRPAQTLVDARSAARYKGDTEPFDPVAGHIPGALNRPFNTNLNAQGFMKSPAELAAEFTVLLNGRDASSVVHHCGSGISAIPNLLAMEVAGLGSTALYAGSWSEWCNTPGLPCAQA
ncbi:MAG: 3-mercaptopyruvate sulfurtransferase [Pseudomonadota bacterium]